MDYDYLVVGAGLYGCVFAHEAAKAGKKSLVIDKRNTIAGNIHTSLVRGICVHDYGAHIFHTSDEEVWQYVQKFACFNNYINSPIAIYEDELYNLPFNMNTFSKMWGIKTPKQAQDIIAKQSQEAVVEILKRRGVSTPTEDDITNFKAENLEEQGLSLAGKDVFEKLVKGYTEKQWGRSCDELPAFIIKRLPFRFVYDNNYFNDPYQGIPMGGYTAMCERLLGMRDDMDGLVCGIQAHNNITVKLSTDFFDFVDMSRQKPGKAISSRDGDTFAKVVYTGMIDEFFDFELGNLEYRSLKFETTDLPDVDNYQGNAVVNYTKREVPYTRIIEHKHFEFGKGEGTVITKEYPADWRSGDEPYYPMNDDKNNVLFERYQNKAKNWSQVIFGGRLGQYKYYNMDQVVRQALDAFRALT